MFRVVALSALYTWLAVALPSPAVAGIDEGVTAYERGDYATALREFRSLAEQGEVNAQSILGLMYYYGQGVTQDFAEAVKWYRKAAEQGFAKAQYNLGLMYYHGLSVSQDFAEAVKWYRKAAEQGDRGHKIRHRFNGSAIRGRNGDGIEGCSNPWYAMGWRREGDSNPRNGVNRLTV